MQISILAAGSRGDTQPYIALGLALKNEGHAVRIAGFQTFEALVTGHGLEFYPIRGDISAVTASIGAQEGMQADNPLKFFLSFNKLKALAVNLQQDFYQACAGSDAVLYHPGAAIGYFIAQEMQIPSVLAAPFPMTPTRAYPSLIFYEALRGVPGLNYLSHKIIEQVFWFASSGPVKEFWRKQFGRIPAQFGSPYTRQTTRSLRNRRKDPRRKWRTGGCPIYQRLPRPFPSIGYKIKSILSKSRDRWCLDCVKRDTNITYLRPPRSIPEPI